SSATTSCRRCGPSGAQRSTPRCICPSRTDRTEKRCSYLTASAQFAIENCVELAARVPLDPGLMPAPSEQNEAEASQAFRERFAHPRSRMRIVVSVDRRDGTLDLFRQSQQPPTPPHLRRFVPYCPEGLAPETREILFHGLFFVRVVLVRL